jgi:hypothetical protein
MTDKQIAERLRQIYDCRYWGDVRELADIIDPNYDSCLSQSQDVNLMGLLDALELAYNVLQAKHDRLRKALDRIANQQHLGFRDVRTYHEVTAYIARKALQEAGDA